MSLRFRREHLFLLLSVAISCFLAFRIRILREQVTNATRDAGRAENALYTLRGQRLKLIATITSLPLNGGISGYDHTSKAEFRANTVADGIYYITAPNCAASFPDIPFLNKLSERFPGLVIALSPGNSDSLPAYVRDNKIVFPVLGSPESFLLELLPRGVTPITVVVSKGRISSFVEGSLSEDDRMRVTSFLARIHPSAVRAAL